jgi:predicted O-methyltransferase YrrM
MTWSDVEAATFGYLHPGEGEALAEWAARSPGPIVEIGSYCGKSTLWLAQGSQPVISVDHHRGNPEMQKGRECFHEAVWDEETQAVDSAPEIRRTLHRAGLEHRVTVIAAPSEQVAAWWTTPIGMLFIDGDHFDTPHDYAMWSPWLLPDSILAFHDTAIHEIHATIGTAIADGWVERQVVHDCLKVLTR